MKVCVLLLVAALSACSSPAKCPDPITIVNPPDAGPAVVVTDADGGAAPFDEPFDGAGLYTSPPCAAACANLQTLGCPEGRTRPGEDSCYIVCRRSETTAGRIDFKPRCISAARTKPSLRACGTYRCL